MQSPRLASAARLAVRAGVRPLNGSLALALGLGLTLQGAGLAAAGLPDSVALVKRSLVAVGTHMAVRANRYEPRGTGFAVAPNLAVTNAHNLPVKLDAERKETYAVFVPAGGERMDVREAELLRRDEDHDLLLLRYKGAALPAVALGRSQEVREGQEIAFSGFPLVGILGLHAATHRGIVSAIAPVALPAGSGRELKPELLKRLGTPFDIFQLDATAYPGNSGSPLFDVASGRVLGVVNSVFVKGTKELALTDPSGISYAIPVDHVRALLAQPGAKP